MVVNQLITGPTLYPLFWQSNLANEHPRYVFFLQIKLSIGGVPIIFDSQPTNLPRSQIFRPAVLHLSPSFEELRHHATHGATANALQGGDAGAHHLIYTGLQHPTPW